MAAAATPSGPTQEDATLSGRMENTDKAYGDKFPLAFLITHVGAVEQALRGRELREPGLVLLDLRVKLAGEEPEHLIDDVDGVLGRAKWFSKREPGKLATHLEEVGFPQDYTVPEIATALRKIAAQKKEDDRQPAMRKMAARFDATQLDAPVLDTVVCVARGRFPSHPRFEETYHSLIFVTFGQVLSLRKDIMGGAPETHPQLPPEEEREVRERRDTCGLCGMRPEKMRRCSRCAQAYCSVEHQRSHWRSHKAECAQRQRMVAAVTKTMGAMGATEEESNRASAKFAKKFGKLTSECLETSACDPKALEAFGIDARRFHERFLAPPGLLGKFVLQFRHVALYPGMGDDDATKAAKAARGERRLIIFMNRAGADDLWDRYIAAQRAGTGKLNFNDTLRIMDDTELVALVAKQVFPSKVHKHMQKFFDVMNPAEEFIVFYSDPQRGPLCDTTTLTRFDGNPIFMRPGLAGLQASNGS